MGYGEFGGTGSVRWEVRYDDTKTPAAVDDPKKKRKLRSVTDGDTDQDVSAGIGSSLFVVCSDADIIKQDAATGEVVVLVKLQKKDGQVRLYWGVDSVHAGALSSKT